MLRTKLVQEREVNFKITQLTGNWCDELRRILRFNIVDKRIETEKLIAMAVSMRKSHFAVLSCFRYRSFLHVPFSLVCLMVCVWELIYYLMQASQTALL